MMKFWFLVSLFFVITTTYSQSVLEKKVNLPKLVRKIAAPDKENFVLSPDGTILCIIRPASLYNVLLMNMGDGAITDSIAVNSYAPLMKWSADSRTLLFYTEEYPRSQFTLYNRKGEVLKKIETPYPVLNFGVDSTATEIVATVYDLPESGAVYKSDLTTAFIYPKGKKYTYKICSFDIASGALSDSFTITATYPRVEGKWKGNWLLLLCQSEAEFQATAALSRVDFKNKKVSVIANSNEFFTNESFMNIKTLFAQKLYMSSGTFIVEFSEKENRFNRIFQSNEIESIQSGYNNSKGLLVAGVKGRRWAENEIWVYKNENEFSIIDTRDYIPHLVSFAEDTVLAVSFTSEEVVARKYPVDFTSIAKQPEVLIQNSIEPENRLVIPGSDFLLEYNRKEWQVTDQSSQLIVHQQREYEKYGMKFISLGSNPYIIKYTSSSAELIPVGNWKETGAALSLQHPLLKEGNSVYSGMAGLLKLAFNPTTSLLTGLFSSNDFYYVATWDIKLSSTPQNVIKVERKKIPGDKKSLYGEGGAVPILLSHIAYKMQEAEWRKANEGYFLNKLRQLTTTLSSFTIDKLNDFDDFSWRYSVETGKVTGPFVYQDSIYGNLLIDLAMPSRSLYFCHKPLNGTFPGYRYTKYLGENFGTRQITLSGEGNFVVISDLGSITCYELGTMQHRMIPKENKEASFDGGHYFLLEDKGILVGNTAWHDVSDLRPVHTMARTQYTDAAIYLPEKKLFIVNLSAQKGYLEIQLDRLSITRKDSISENLQNNFTIDTTFRSYFPEKKYWMMGGQKGIGYDSSSTVSFDNMGRLFTSSLNGNINFIQLLPGQNQVLVGNSNESTFECWDVKAEQMLFKLVVIDEKNFFIQSKSGYYYATPNALQQVGFLQDGSGIPASFLDAGLNRPDLILTDLFDTAGIDTRQLISIYKKAVTRKSKNSISIIPGQSPVVTVSRPLTSLQRQPGYDIRYTVQAKANPVSYFSVQVNNVLVWDTSFSKPLFTQSLAKRIQLTSGENQLVYLVKDSAGNSSTPVFQRVVYQPLKPVKSKTYVIAMAVNQYSDTAKNLKYAVKDGKDLLAAFRTIEGGQIVTDSLFDAMVTAENIRKLKEKLLQTTIEDKVVISFSGHGMLDDSMNFYLATANMDFMQPRMQGLAFNELEEILADIPARKKLLLIDACHSGNIEKEDALTENEKKMIVPQVKVQSDTTGSAKGFGIKRPSGVSLQQVISQLFASSSSSTGTEVIAATAGNAYAYESPQWNNGVFTYAVLKAFRNNSDLDMNFNQQISIKELKRFVYATVMELTNGKQQPLSRYENPNYDWDLLPMRYD